MISLTGLQDYCVEQGFHAECPDGTVLLMEKALYGRMELGDCLTYDVGLNCQRYANIVKIRYGDKALVSDGLAFWSRIFD